MTDNRNLEFASRDESTLEEVGIAWHSAYVLSIQDRQKHASELRPCLYTVPAEKIEIPSNLDIDACSSRN